MKHLASIALLFALITPVLAQDPVEPVPAEARIVLTAPSTARIGELIRLDASESVADSFEWALVPQILRDFETYAGGSKACFSARTAGDYQFVVACAKDGTVDVKVIIIRVLAPPETPQSASLAAWIPFWAWDYDLPEQQRLELAASFEALANRADLQDPAAWAQATAAANRALLGDDIDTWKGLLGKIGASLQKLAESGALSTPEDHRAIWLEIAQGLRNC